MIAPASEPVPYRVAYSERVRQRLLALADVARERGDGEAFLAALREFHRRLGLYPQFGEPLLEASRCRRRQRLPVRPPLTTGGGPGGVSCRCVRPVRTHRVPRGALARLKLHARKRARAVSRGGGDGNVTSLPDRKGCAILAKATNAPPDTSPMPDKRAPDNLGNIIGGIVGLPLVLIFFVIWSPFLLLAAIVNLFSPEEPKPAAHAAAQTYAGAGTKRQRIPLSKGGFLLVAAGLFAVFVFLLNFKSGGGTSGVTHSDGGNSNAAYSTPVSAPVWVNGYRRQDGTYVSGHYPGPTHQLFCNLPCGARISSRKPVL